MLSDAELSAALIDVVDASVVVSTTAFVEPVPPVSLDDDSVGVEPDVSPVVVVLGSAPLLAGLPEDEDEGEGEGDDGSSIDEPLVPELVVLVSPTSGAAAPQPRTDAARTSCAVTRTLHP